MAEGRRESRGSVGGECEGDRGEDYSKQKTGGLHKDQSGQEQQEQARVGWGPGGQQVEPMQAILGHGQELGPWPTSLAKALVMRKGWQNKFWFEKPFLLLCDKENRVERREKG